MDMRLMMLRKQVQMMTHHLPEIDKGQVAKWGYHGEQGVIFMQQFKRVIVEKSHQQCQINQWQEDDIETYEGMKL